MDMPQPTAAPPTKKGANKDTRKPIWIFTYSSSGPSIVAEMLRESGISALECHTAVEGDAKYTLLHCERKHRIGVKALKKVSETLAEKYSIVLPSPPAGFAGPKEDLETHPGWRFMVDQIVQGKELETYWVNDPSCTDALTFQKGLFYAHFTKKDDTIAPPSKKKRRAGDSLTAQLAKAREELDAANSKLLQLETALAKDINTFEEFETFRAGLIEENAGLQLGECKA